ncbi:hypothetical protein HPB48_009956 [Haemaphysalis longicornis]|uniref:Uncharacterized protein n=1 Tax=Haemaphysalis longicornis TaxID=44386 RepID=A0A9J6GSX5_HAELO|nr:hypothetical protein HPB48_009956 [Haemaphysalis longicornis]
MQPSYCRIPTWIGIIATGSGIMFLFVGVTLTILLCKLFNQQAAREVELRDLVSAVRPLLVPEAGLPQRPALTRSMQVDTVDRSVDCSVPQPPTQGGPEAVVPAVDGVEEASVLTRSSAGSARLLGRHAPEGAAEKWYCCRCGSCAATAWGTPRPSKGTEGPREAWASCRRK